MNDLDFIVGLAKQETDALGFIPRIGIAEYIHRDCFVIAEPRGRKLGYVLHGVPVPYRHVSITQAMIDFDFRNAGHGVDVVNVVIERAIAGYAAGVQVRCGSDLASNEFWKHMGFQLVGIEQRNNRRKRAINVYSLPLLPTLFG